MYMNLSGDIRRVFACEWAAVIACFHDTTAKHERRSEERRWAKIG
jgi:hypothetical protein